jgi:hypothetical protein
MMIVNLVGLLVFCFSVPLLLDKIVNLVGLLVFCFSVPLLLDKIVNLVGLLVFWFSVPLLLDDDCESCWFASVLVLCSSAFR